MLKAEAVCVKMQNSEGDEDSRPVAPGEILKAAKQLFAKQQKCQASHRAVQKLLPAKHTADTANWELIRASGLKMQDLSNLNKTRISKIRLYQLIVPLLF